MSNYKNTKPVETAAQSNDKLLNPDFQNLILNKNLPKVKTVIIDNDKKKEKINIDGNELLMEFHCEV